MNKDLSVKISIAGFICTLMVVYRHSLNYLAFFHSWSPQGLNGIVEDSCMRLTQIAVPYFFMVSGSAPSPKLAYNWAVMGLSAEISPKSTLKRSTLFWGMILPLLSGTIWKTAQNDNKFIFSPFLGLNIHWESLLSLWMFSKNCIIFVYSVWNQNW